MRNFATVSIAGVPTALASRQETAALFIDFVRLGRQGRLTRPLLASSMNGQTIYEAGRSPDLLEQFNRFDFNSIDGQPAVLISRFWRHGFPERVATTDLIHDVVELGRNEGVRHYLFGATSAVVLQAAHELREQHQGAIVAGAHHGYVSEDELAAVAEEIRNCAAEIVWVCMGVPREQRFALRLAELVPSVSVIKTGGGVLDFIAGERLRAPQWMQAAGLEWAFRMALEPRRLLKRYLVSNPVALARLVFSRRVYRDADLRTS